MDGPPGGNDPGLGLEVAGLHLGLGELAGPDGPGGLQGTGEIEVRASWTPLDANALGRHLRAWAEMMGTAAGLPPPGVTALPSPAAG